MSRSEASVPFFDQAHAAEYDQRFARLGSFKEALHLLMAAVFAGLPERARVLCVGAGTGAEIMDMAQRFPGWHFTAVEPSGPMLDVFRRKAEQAGLTARCVFHEGYLDSLPPCEPFDVATSILVSQFVLDVEARTQFFREIAVRLRPGGLLASADLAADLATLDGARLLEVWFRLLAGADVPPEKLEALRAAYGRDVAVVPVARVGEIIAAGGFEAPQVFLQTGLIHAWHSRRAVMAAV